MFSPMLVIFIGLLGMVGSIKAGTNPQPHYYQVLVPFICVIGTLLIFQIREIRQISPKLQTFALSLLAVLTLGYLVYFQWFDETRTRDPKVIMDGISAENDLRLARLINTLTEPDETVYQWGMFASLYFSSQRRAASGIVMHHAFYFAPEKLRMELYQKLAAQLDKAKPAFIIFSDWSFRIDQEYWMAPFKQDYHFLGLFGKRVIYERNRRARPAKAMLSSMTLDAEPFIKPWREPQLLLFPGWKNVTVMDPTRFAGAPLLPSGNGSEAPLVDSALGLFRQKQFIQARDLLFKALEINPKNLAAQAALGVYNEATGQYYLAMGNYQTVAEEVLHPFNEYYLESRELLMQQAAAFIPPAP